VTAATLRAFAPVEIKISSRFEWMTDFARSPALGSRGRIQMTVSRNLVGVILCVALALAAGRSRAAERNACGCTQTDSGACICDKKATCGCPGQCEPRGCEAQRERTFQRELDAETRKAREADRQHATPKDEASPKAAPATTAAPRPVRDMTSLQQKELVRLLDLYFAAHPDARSASAGNLRNQIQPPANRR